MKHKNILMSALIAGALCVTSALGLTLKDNLNEIHAGTTANYSITLNDENGQVNESSETKEVTFDALTDQSKTPTTFAHYKCNAGPNNEKHNFINISSDGEFYNVSAITNISKISVTANMNNPAGEVISIYLSKDKSHPSKLSNIYEYIELDKDGKGSVELDGSYYFFNIAAELSAILFKEVKIEYTCLAKLDTSKTTYTYDASNAAFVNGSNNYEHIFTYDGVKRTFYGSNLSAAKDSLVMLSFKGDTYYCMDEYVGLSQIVIEINKGYEKAEVCYGTSACDQTNAVKVTNDVMVVSIPKGNNFFTIRSLVANVAIKSITITFDEFIATEF